MTLKACCYNIYSIIKRQLWLSALWFAMLFFCLPVQTALVLQSLRNARGWFAPQQEYLARAAMDLQSVFGPQGIGLLWLLIVMSFVSALVYGAYMHRPKQVDFYHSQPISRARLLLQNAAAGLLAILIPYVLNLLLAVFVTLAMGAGAVLPWGALFSGLAIHTLYFIAIFATVLIAVVISGKTVVAGVTGVFLLSALPALLGLALLAANEFYPVFYQDLYDWYLILRWLSPAAAYAVTSAYGLHYGPLPIIAYDILALTAAVLLYRRRGSEAAGQAIAFTKARPVLKYAMACLAAAAFAMIFHSISYNDNGYFWWYFGAVTGGFLATQITEIVYAMDFRAVLRNLRGLGIFLAIFLAFSTCAIRDIGGFNSAVPAVNQVVSAEIYFPGINGYATDTWGYWSSPYSIYNQDAERAALNREERDFLASGPVTSPAAIAAAVNIAARYANAYLPQAQQQPLVSESQLAQWRQQGKQYLLDYYEGYYDGYLNQTACRVVFTLQNGRKMARSYMADRIPVQYMLDDLAVIYAEEDFRAAQIRELMFADDRYAPEKLELFELYYELPPLDWLSAEDRDILLAALRADLLELSVEQQSQSMPIGAFHLRLYGAAVDYPLEKEQWEWDARPYCLQRWPIYASFERTMDFLAAKGYGPELWQPQLNDIESISLVEAPYWDGGYADKYGYDYGAYSVKMEILTGQEFNRTNITDPAEIAEIMAKSYPAEAQWNNYNCFIDIDRRVEVEVSYRGPGGQIYVRQRMFCQWTIDN